MNLLFTKAGQKRQRSLIDILREADNTYVVSETYLSKAKENLLAVIQESDNIELLDVENTIIETQHGETQYTFTLLSKMGNILVEVKSRKINVVEPSILSITNHDAISHIRSLLESNPVTTPTFYYIMGVIDTLAASKRISAAQRHYWISYITKKKEESI